MTGGQTTVLVLLIFLALLEVAVHPAVKSYFKSIMPALAGGITK